MELHLHEKMMQILKKRIIKIFRQKLIGDWNSVINQIEFELKKLK